MISVEPVDSTSDLALMQRFAQGDVSAFEMLYERHEKPLWRFLVHSMRDSAAAEDVMQETWITVTQQAARYSSQSAHTAEFRTWLLTIARSRMIDHLRKQKPQIRAEDFQDSDPTDDVAPADSAFGPLRQLESREQARALLRALEALPYEQREAFLLQAESGLSVEEIAESCQVSFETAKSRLRYARNKLKKCLAAWNPSPASSLEAQ